MVLSNLGVAVIQSSAVSLCFVPAVKRPQDGTMLCAGCHEGADHSEGFKGQPNGFPCLSWNGFEKLSATVTGRYHHDYHSPSLVHPCLLQFCLLSYFWQMRSDLLAGQSIVISLSVVSKAEPQVTRHYFMSVNQHPRPFCCL